jgi:hypothetical protein
MKVSENFNLSRTLKLTEAKEIGRDYARWHARILAMSIYRSTGLIVAAHIMGALLLVASWAGLVYLFIKLLTGTIAVPDMAEIWCASVFYAVAGNLLQLTAKTAILIWLMNLPDYVEDEYLVHTEFCLRIMDIHSERRYVKSWYLECDEIVAAARKKISTY